MDGCQGSVVCAGTLTWRPGACNDREWNGSYNADFRTVNLLLEVIRRVFRFVEVNLTPNKKGSFGGYGIELDSA